MTSAHPLDALLDVYDRASDLSDDQLMRVIVKHAPSEDHQILAAQYLVAIVANERGLSVDVAKDRDLVLGVGVCDHRVIDLLPENMRPIALESIAKSEPLGLEMRLTPSAWDVRFTPFEKEETFTPPDGVRAAAKRSLEWLKQDLQGDGFTDVGRARASQLARGGAVSLSTIRRMSAYFDRHQNDGQAEGFSGGEKGYPSPGRVAWDAWGGDAGKTWADGIAQRFKKEFEPENNLTMRQKIMYEVFESIAEQFGDWDYGSGADGAHYISPGENVFAKEGLKCANCVFYEGGGGCELLAGPVDPEAVCKLWIIDERLIVSEDPEMIDEGSTEVDMRLVSKADDERRFTLGPMYVPNQLDAHNEWTDPNELQVALWDYVRSGDRRIRLQHNRDVVAGEWVEAMTWPFEIEVPMMRANGTSGMTKFPENTVFLGVVWEPWAWELVRTGQLRGYSIGGKAERVLVDLGDVDRNNN